MENYTSAKDTYIQRMNQTAKSKFEVIAGYLKPGMKVLDFGSGISPEFIADVESTGAKYVAYDISQTVQTELANMGVDVLADLQNVENEFDIIFMSSVFHEIISYLSRQERTKTLQYVDKALKPSGKLIIRDWGHLSHQQWLNIQFQQHLKTQLLKLIFGWMLCQKILLWVKL